MSRGPLPSQLCLLSELPTRDVGDKVRFLGCVLHYTLQHAVLELRHPHPKGADVTRALVDVNLLLASIKHEQTAVGSWLNVIGYIKAKRKREGKKEADTSAAGVSGGATEVRTTAWDVRVQAVTLWSAGSLDVQQYEKVLSGRIQDGQPS